MNDARERSTTRALVAFCGRGQTSGAKNDSRLSRMRDPRGRTGTSSIFVSVKQWYWYDNVPDPATAVV